MAVEVVAHAHKLLLPARIVKGRAQQPYIFAAQKIQLRNPAAAHARLKFEL